MLLLGRAGPSWLWQMGRLHSPGPPVAQPLSGHGRAAVSGSASCFVAGEVKQLARLIWHKTLLQLLTEAAGRIYRQHNTGQRAAMLRARQYTQHDDTHQGVVQQVLQAMFFHRIQC
jgi:hypothetical protein